MAIFRGSSLGTFLRDFMIGSNGNDTIHGGGGDDIINGGAGNDTLFGDAGIDMIHGSIGDDVISGGDGNDLLFGDAGTDVIHGDNGNDYIDGGIGNDTLFGDAGNDTLIGGLGHDFLSGGDGIDFLNGGVGNDIIQGGVGNDILIGGIGNDIIDGGDGVDTAIFVGNASSYHITYNHDNSLTITGIEGTDVLKNVEVLKFNNTIIKVNVAPNTNDVTATGLEDAPSIAITLSGTDPGGAIKSFNLSSLPTHGALYLDAGMTTLVASGVDYNASHNTLTLYYKPDANFNGIDSFNYAATDNSGWVDLSPARASISVTSVDDAPIAKFDVASTLENDAVTGNVLTNDIDRDGPIKKVVQDSVGTHQGDFGTLSLLADGSYTYTPQNLDYLQAGQQVLDQFNYTMTDGTLSSSSTLTVTITGVNDAPTAIELSNNSISENVSGAIGNITVTDPDDTSHTFMIDDSRFEVVNGVLGLRSGQSLDYETASTVPIHITATDSGNESFTQAFTISVTNVDGLFTNGNDTVDFNTASQPALIENLYNAMGGNDTVTLPTAAIAATLGYDTAQYFSGDSGDDVISGTGNSGINYKIDGADGNDTLTGGNGDDTILGGAGNDVISGGPGTDILDGESGTNTISYAYLAAPDFHASGITIDIGANTVTIAGESSDSIANFNNVIGTDFNDDITGSSNDNVLMGGDGNDFLFGMAGNDTLIGGSGVDVLNGGDGNNDAVDYGYAQFGATVSLVTGHALIDFLPGGPFDSDTLVGIEQIYGSNSPDTLFGDNSGNLLVGRDGGDILNGNGGNDFVFGNDGNDIIYFGNVANDQAIDFDPNTNTVSSGQDVFDGGDGTDILTAEPSKLGGVTLDMTNNIYKYTSELDINTSFVSNIENLGGSNSNDLLVGNSQNNAINGNDGDDVLKGAGGDDTLNGGDGTDTAVYSSTIDNYTYTNHSGVLSIFGPDGNDTLTNIETLQFAASTVDVATLLDTTTPVHFA